MPGRQIGPGVHAVRTSVPARIAITRASSQAAPKTVASIQVSSTATSDKAPHSARPGNRLRAEASIAVGLGGIWASGYGNPARLHFPGAVRQTSQVSAVRQISQVSAARQIILLV